MAQLNVNAVRSEALFVSTLQRSDEPSVGQIREAVSLAVRALGSRGCAALVAQEFGDHPEIAVARMQWARQLVEAAYGAARLEAAGATRLFALSITHHTRRAA
jgi:hypothetical protein